MTRAALDPFWSFSSLSCLLLGSFAHAGCSDAAGTDPDLDDGNGAEGTGGTSIDDGELGNGGENRNSTGGAIGFEPGSGGSNPDVTTTNICASADEDSSATLTCPEGGIITSIVFASFGEPVGECGGFTQTECHAS